MNFLKKNILTTSWWDRYVGCSIGSLGGEPDEPGVQNVTVRSSVFIGTQNGVRIKTWAKPNNGLVQGIQFRDIIMRHVQNPILIDQNYCPGNINCPTQVRHFICTFFSSTPPNKKI